MRGRLARRALLGGLLAAPALRRAWAGEAGTLVIGAPAGTATDLRARALAPFLERHMPRWTLRVVNHRPVAALRQVAEARDLTLGWVATPVLPARLVDTPGTDEPFAALTLLGAVQAESLLFVAPSEAPLTSVDAVIGQTRLDGAARPLGTPPEGSAPHLMALRLQAMAGAPLNIVAFPTAAAAHLAALGGDLGAACLPLGAVLPALRDGRLAGLAVTTLGLHGVDVPVDNLAGSRGTAALLRAAAIWRGLAMPTAAPAAVRLGAALRDVVADPDYHDQAAAAGFAPRFLNGPDWTARTAAARNDLAELWRISPWRATGTG